MNPQARKDKLTVRELPDETLVYDLERHKAHCLNATCALVWKHCDGRTSLAGLARLVQENLHIAQGEAVVQLALEQLSRRHLLEEQVEPLTEEARLSRRAVLRRLALTAVALPLAMTIAAPKAHAQISKEILKCGVFNDKGICPSGETCCRASIGGTCVNLQTNNANCGSCGNACQTFETCINGQCQGQG